MSLGSDHQHDYPKRDWRPSRPASPAGKDESRRIGNSSWIAHRRLWRILRVSFGQPDRHSPQLIDFICVVWRNCPIVAQ